MHVIRVGLPALTGAALLPVAALLMGPAFQAPDLALVGAVHATVLPAAAAIGLLLTALAIARRTRAGYVLGLLVAILATLGGGWLVLFSLHYLADGGLGAAISAGVIVVAAIWIVIWLAYGLLMLRGRASFAAGWQRADRRLGIVIGSLAAFATATFLVLGFVQAQSVAADETSQADRGALVAATAVAARVIDVTYGQATGGTPPEAVQTLTLELSFTSPSAYHLAQPPTLCLVDSAMAQDPAFKPGSLCWGTGGTPLVLADGFGDLSMPSTSRQVRVELARGDSPCAFGAGTWDALVQIAPTGGDSGTGQEVDAVHTTFRLDPSGAPATSGSSVADACLGSIVSP